MYFLKPLVVAGVAVWGVHYWHQNHSPQSSRSVESRADENGFVYMPPLEGQKPNTVYVVVAPDRSADAWRAIQLADELSDKGIPVVSISRVTFLPIGLVGMNDAGVDHISTLLGGPSPVVFVDGKAKAAATLDEVQAEFRAGSAPVVRTDFSWR